VLIDNLLRFAAIRTLRWSLRVIRTEICLNFSLSGFFCVTGKA
jgi:hypothetical protein